jgi:TPR repeat protein
MIDAVRLRQTDEPARLTISAADAGANVAVVIGGLAPGSALSAGTLAGPNTWRLSTEDFNDTAVTPPRGFVGVMDLTLELRLADNTVVDRKGLQLEWSAKNVLAPVKTQPRQLAAPEIALMMKSGAEFMANGNIGAARMMFQPAAEAGEPVAAFALAETYDPLVLRKMGAKGGITSDIALAHTWYERAMNLGSTVAPARLERLARLPE